MRVYADLEQLNRECRKLKRLHFSLQDESTRLNRVVQYGFKDIEGKGFGKIQEHIESENKRVKQYVRILDEFARSLDKIIRRYQECEQDAANVVEVRRRVVSSEEQVQYTDLRNVREILKKLRM